MPICLALRMPLSHCQFHDDDDMCLSSYSVFTRYVFSSLAASLQDTTLISLPSHTSDSVCVCVCVDLFGYRVCVHVFGYRVCVCVCVLVFGYRVCVSVCVCVCVCEIERAAC